MLDAVKTWARNLKRDIVALWIAARDPRTPILAKVVAGCVAAYALSPIDLIPDFVPVLGYLDDLLLVPLGIWIAVRLIPPALMAELRERASTQMRPTSPAAAAIIIGVWLLGAVVFGALIWRSDWMAPVLEAGGQ